jgi:hypothetical protein
MRFVVEVIIIDVGLPGFLGVSYSGSVFCASVVSLSMSVVLRGAKKLRVNTCFRGSFTAADVGTPLVDFFAVYVFWYVTSCSPAEIRRRFGGMCCLHLHDEE